MDRPILSSPGTGPRGVMWRRALFSAVAVGVLLTAVWRFFPGFFVTTFGYGPPIVSRPLPEFTQTSSEKWLNSPPLRVSDLRGKVVFLDVWTFG